MGTMGFDEALQILKESGSVARQGWNGKNMYLFLVSENEYELAQYARSPGETRGRLTQKPWIAMRTADGCVVPWLASQSDLLEEDWVDKSE